MFLWISNRRNKEHERDEGKGDGKQKVFTICICVCVCMYVTAIAWNSRWNIQTNVIDEM